MRRPARAPASRCGRPPRLLQEAIAHCESVKDVVSREILESILEDTEEHNDWLETQIELVRTVGLENYLAEKIGGDEG